MALGLSSYFERLGENKCGRFGRLQACFMPTAAARPRMAALCRSTGAPGDCAEAAMWTRDGTRDRSASECQRPPAPHRRAEPPRARQHSPREAVRVIAVEPDKGGG
jgi:hypothetical protein